MPVAVIGKAANSYRYWLSGGCLAGDACPFSHDPSMMVNSLNINDPMAAYGASPSAFQLQDQMDQFPALQTQGHYQPSSSLGPQSSGQFPVFASGNQSRGRGGLSNLAPNSRPQSRPNSHHQTRTEITANISMDDPEAFPTLAATNSKRPSKHHGHRTRHGHNNLERDIPGSMADVVRMTPSPGPGQRKSEAIKKIRSSGGSENPAALKIPAPQHIPWLETGERANQQYLKHRQEAIKHGTVRNKFLQR